MTDDILSMMATPLEEKIDFDCLDTLPLAMAYVPMQKWCDVYNADVAFSRGTIFAQLDKPFLGRRATQ